MLYRTISEAGVVYITRMISNTGVVYGMPYD